MADILIRGMEMPKYTTKAEFGIDADGNPLCMVHHSDGTEPGIYDVVPLPEGHGRLGDLDALINELHNLLDKREKDAAFSGDREAGVTWDDAINKIIAAPIIIPAEGGGAQ